MKKLIKTNFRVEVHPELRGFAHDEDKITLCEEIAAQIRRHVDGLPTYSQNGVYVEIDTEGECEYCGSKWSEDSTEYNGGCCEQDVTDQERRGEKL